MSRRPKNLTPLEHQIACMLTANTMTTEAEKEIYFILQRKTLGLAKRSDDTLQTPAYLRRKKAA